MSGYQHQGIFPEGSPQSKLRHTSKSLGNAKWMSGCKVCMAGPSWHCRIIDHPKAKKEPKRMWHVFHLAGWMSHTLTHAGCFLIDAHHKNYF